MPSLATYKNLVHTPTTGGARARDSKTLMNVTWNDDISSRVAYFYDYYHDDYKTTLDNLHPEKDSKKIPMDIKYIINTTQTYDKDPISYHIQLRPGQENVIPYYDEYFTNRYSAHYPIGLMVDIPDEKGNYNKWMVVSEANYNDTLFPTFDILRCNYVVRYICDGVRYEVPSVLRSQNS